MNNCLNKQQLKETAKTLSAKAKKFIEPSKDNLWSLVNLSLILICLSLALVTNSRDITSINEIISPLATATSNTLTPLKEEKKGYQVYGYAPYWTINKLDNVDFNVLTTFAYFGVPIQTDGSLDRTDQGYKVFMSDKATNIFQRAHDAGTKVNLTVTLMENDKILAFLDNPQAQERTINEIVAEVKNRGIDGVSIDIEYAGKPDPSYRAKFSKFVKNTSDRMHAEIPGSQVTVAVYALSAKQPQLYDIGAIAESADSVFMMAYDFSVKGSKSAQPTAPLYGHKEGKYYYDIATAVEDFLKVMPAEKLILGVPYYGYNYLVYEPQVKAATRPAHSWRGKPAVQTYEIAQANVNANMTGINDYKEGWDNEAQVGWRAYKLSSSDTWRMIFVEDERSLGIKYDFAKSQNLGGVGIWALGFDNGHTELWTLLSSKFGTKNIADNRGLLYQK
jgi:spore germination protein